jgi:hypothetical protein
MPNNESAVLFTLNQLLKPDIKTNIEIDNTFNYQRNMHYYKQKPKLQIYFKYKLLSNNGDWIGLKYILFNK